MLLVLALSATLPTAEAAATKQVSICHYASDRGTYNVIAVDDNAVSKHIARHGDSFPGEWFTDVDGDGYGDSNAATSPCPNPGFVADSGDCDDGDATVNPGAEEVPYDGTDNDCAEGTRDDDLDDDGFGLADDCDDLDASINPDAEEVCDDATDNNCDATMDEGCGGGCPCYTAASLLAVAEAFDWTSFEDDSEYYRCGTSTYDGNSDYQLDWRRSASSEPDSDPALDGASARISSSSYSYVYEGTDGSDVYEAACGLVTVTVSYDYYTNTRTRVEGGNEDYNIDETQVEACNEIIVDVAAPLGLTCRND